MSETIKSIGVSALTALILTLTLVGGVNYLEDDNVYYCESRALVMQCDSLSSTSKTCYGESTKRCLDGWIKVVNDLPDVVEEPTYIMPDTTSLRYTCGIEGCFKTS